MKLIQAIKAISYFGFILSSSLAISHVTPTFTRLIYHAEDNFANVYVNNSDKKQSYGLEAWTVSSNPLKPAEIEKDSMNHFFIVSPKFSIVPPKSDELPLRVIILPKTRAKLPKDRETLFYLEFQDAPPETIPGPYKAKKKPNISGGMQIAIHSQIKMMYRPEGITQISNNELSGKIVGKINGKVMLIDNQSHYVVNSLKLLNKKPDILPNFLKTKNIQKNIERQLSLPVGDIYLCRF
ncbi:MULTISPECIES: fimbrial biogenesis chaperone [Cysteiniphilum]|uniref:fimbrial biogenesis chaperone n=1 Tax=Cysteiniphilum TaxID=2056696 RepID=UPI00177F86FB|nr:MULTISPECIES: fimbria/pilus periplasmic chaperone [Cysteiniphilum]